MWEVHGGGAAHTRSLNFGLHQVRCFFRCRRIRWYVTIPTFPRSSSHFLEDYFWAMLKYLMLRCPANLESTAKWPGEGSCIPNIKLSMYFQVRSGKVRILQCECPKRHCALIIWLSKILRAMTARERKVNRCIIQRKSHSWLHPNRKPSGSQ